MSTQDKLNNLLNSTIISEKGIKEIIPRFTNYQLMELYNNREYLKHVISEDHLIACIMKNKSLSRINAETILHNYARGDESLSLLPKVTGKKFSYYHFYINILKAIYLTAWAFIACAGVGFTTGLVERSDASSILFFAWNLVVIFFWLIVLNLSKLFPARISWVLPGSPFFLFKKQKSQCEKEYYEFMETFSTSKG